MTTTDSIAAASSAEPVALRADRINEAQVVLGPHHRNLAALLNGIPAADEKDRLRTVIADCEQRHAVLDRSMPAIPDDVGDGNMTDILILLELRAASADATVSEKAKSAISTMTVRMAALARVTREEHAISVAHSEALRRLKKINRMESGASG